MEQAAAPAIRRTNWWGLASTCGLFVWILCWLKNEPANPRQQILCYGPLLLIHWFGFRATKLRAGWIYLLPLGVFWILIVIALSGGITY